MIIFIWNKSCQRLNTMILTKRKEEGAVGLPELATLLLHCFFHLHLDLFHSQHSKQWVSFEHQISSLSLTSSLWMAPEHRSKLTHRSFLISSLLLFSDRYFEKLHLSSRPGPLTSVFSNPDLPERIHKLSLCSQARSPQATIYRFLTPDPASAPSLTYPRVISLTMTGSTIGNYLVSTIKLALKTQLHRKLFPFERLCLQETSPTRVLSSIYRMLREEQTSHVTSPYQRKWEIDLGHPTSSKD